MGPMGPPGVAPSASEISPEGRPSHHLLGPKALLLCVPGPPPHAWAPDGSGPALVLAWGPWGVKGHPELWEAQDRGTPIPGPQRDDAESRSIAFAGRGRCGPALTPRLWARQETGETPPPGAPTPWPGRGQAWPDPVTLEKPHGAWGLQWETRPSNDRVGVGVTGRGSHSTVGLSIVRTPGPSSSHGQQMPAARRPGLLCQLHPLLCPLCAHLPQPLCFTTCPPRGQPRAGSPRNPLELLFWGTPWHCHLTPLWTRVGPPSQPEPPLGPRTLRCGPWATGNPPGGQEKPRSRCPAAPSHWDPPSTHRDPCGLSRG